MNFIQAVISIFICVGAMMALFLFAWYIALPILIVLMCIWGIIILKNKIFSALRGEPNTRETVIQMRRMETETPSRRHVIDVEYTELK